MDASSSLIIKKQKNLPMNLNRIFSPFHTVKRLFQLFPAALTVSSLMGIYLIDLTIESGEKPGSSIILDVFIFSMVAIPLFFTADILCVLRQSDNRQKSIVYSVAVLFMLFFYLAIPMTDAPYALEKHFFQWLAIILASHLLLALIPLIVDRSNQAFFWQYNRMLFKRLIISQLFTYILICGLYLILLTIQFLFETSSSYKVYISIFLSAMYFFHTAFFAAGIPLQPTVSEQLPSKPGLLGSFTQFIAVPLLFVYTFILLWYGIQIAVTGVWPKGMVVFLIFIASFFGLLIFLLLYPFGKHNVIIKISLAEKLFYAALLPLLVLYFIAIEKRVGEYGITESRYCAIALGIWLSIVAVKALLTKTNLLFIPASLFIVIIVSSFGPWSMFSVSKRSQLARLENILTEECLLDNGSLLTEVMWRQDSLPNLVAKNGIPEFVRLPEQKEKQIYDITHYLIATHGHETMLPWYAQDMSAVVEAKSEHGKAEGDVLTELFLKTMGFEYQAALVGDSDDEY